jgi:hypothetical protein
MDSLYSSGGNGESLFLRYCTLANATLAAAALFFWSYIGPYLAEPMSAATRINMQGSTQPDLDNLTYALIWFAPLAAIILSQAASASRYHKLARWIAVYPVAIIAICVTWYFGFSSTYN